MIEELPDDASASIHHIGFAVKSIEATAKSFAQSTNSVWDSLIFDDPAQRARVSFFQPRCDSVLLELIEPRPGDEDSPLVRFIEKGGGLHHICYEVDDLTRHLAWMRARSSLVVMSPVPAVAFSNRRIAWVYTRQKLLLEFLERAPAD